MIKIVQINTTVNTGSTGRIVEQLGLRILDAGFESYIAYSRTGLPSSSKAIPIGNKLDIYRHVLNTRLFDRHGFSSKKATRKLINNLKKIQPNVIHLHNIHGYYLHIDILFEYLKEAKIQVFWTFHDCWPFTGHCSYFDRYNCEKWKTQCDQCPMKSYYPSSWLLDNSKSNFVDKKRLFTSVKNMTIITPSFWLKNLVEQSFLKNQNNIKVIYNGVDVNIFKPVDSNVKYKYQIENNKIILGVASIWSERKGLKDFITLSQQLSDEYKIVLIGLTQKQIETLPKNILGIERTESVHELAELYSAADLYINPTYSDNFPTTNIEALACGTPVITYNTGGSPEAIDKDTGVIVNKGDVKELIKAINTIIDSKDNFTQKQCRDRAVCYFNMNDRYNDYLELYKEAVDING